MTIVFRKLKPFTEPDCFTSRRNPRMRSQWKALSIRREKSDLPDYLREVTESVENPTFLEMRNAFWGFPTQNR